MTNEFHATYEQGVLKLDAPLSVPEQARVTGVLLGIEGPKGNSVEASPQLSDAEFERMLDEFSITGCALLPADFSRADLYLDHD